MNILDIQFCFGCGACYNICPSTAISMIENAEGFREPAIDEATCIHCDACKRVCPSLNPSFTHSTTPKIHAFVADPEVLYASSSGGAFSLLAEKYLVNGGYVVGAAFDEDFSVHHIIISDLVDLDLLRRSKYVQSDQGLCYRETKKLLDSKKSVLYSGTPCQIAGLKGFLGKEYDNLVTIDLLCHGVPPQKHLHEYLEKVYDIKNIATIEMRGREWQTHFRVAMKNGQVFNRILSKDNYLRAFLADLNLRSTCYECKFATLPRQGDITLGDLWTAKKMALGSPYEKKSSIVLLNSEKGETLWQEVLQATTRKVTFMDLTGKFPIEQFNRNITRPTTKPGAKKKNRSIFFRNYLKMGFEQASLRTLYPYDVGLVVFMGDNYGSTATNFSLYKAIQNLGYRPIILDNLTPTIGVSKNFVQKYLDRGSKFFDDDDWQSANLLCDSFVVGSDQSWNMSSPITKRHFEYFLMAFAQIEKRKIAYAPSFGVRRESINEGIKRLYTRMLQRFNAISVREDYGVDMCKQLFGVDAKQVVDPVFLIDRNDYIDYSKRSSFKFDEKFLFAYILEPSLDKCQLIQDSASKLGIKSVIVYDACRYNLLRENFKMDEVIDKPEFIDWLALFVRAEYIITDSFHGACFSFILQKKYIVIKSRMKGRFDSLARMLGKTDEYEELGFYESVDSILGKDDIFKQAEDSRLSKKLTEVREKSLSWLKSALKSTLLSSKEDDNDLLVEYIHLFRDFLNNPIIEAVKPYLTARVDVKLVEGDFDVLSISDNRGEVKKPAWLQKGGAGYQIESYNLSLDVTLRTKTEGDMSIKLKGKNVRDNNKKRIPYWIEYHKFVFNKQLVFNEKKYAWHDEPLIFTFPVTEGEICTFSLEWRPRAYLGTEE